MNNCYKFQDGLNSTLQFSPLTPTEISLGRVSQELFKIYTKTLARLLQCEHIETDSLSRLLQRKQDLMHYLCDNKSTGCVPILSNQSTHILARQHSFHLDYFYIHEQKQTFSFVNIFITGEQKKKNQIFMMGHAPLKIVSLQIVKEI